MLRVEFHCHTQYSTDSLLSIEGLLSAARRNNLERVVITDHNTIAGAQLAQSLDPERIIVGEEIMTTEGELLAAFVSEEVPPGLSAEETIARLRRQGAFISVSHPFDRMRKGHWRIEALRQIAPLIDAIETFNARCLVSVYNHQAAAFAEGLGLPATVGSDAHTAFELGKAVMILPSFHDAASLKASVRQARYEVRSASPFVHLASRYAVWIKRLSKWSRFQ